MTNHTFIAQSYGPDGSSDEDMKVIFSGSLDGCMAAAAAHIGLDELPENLRWSGEYMGGNEPEDVVMGWHESEQEGCGGGIIYRIETVDPDDEEADQQPQRQNFHFDWLVDEKTADDFDETAYNNGTYLGDWFRIDGGGYDAYEDAMSALNARDAHKLLAAAYIGPDEDGIGVCWRWWDAELKVWQTHTPDHAACAA
tara:strand:+ start:1980 stop:2570 length:591 start_codon:yes stop_codon:yes gene_type:complete